MILYDDKSIAKDQDMAMQESRYIRAIHPKTSILPDPEAFKRILKLGWVGQYKIHGHRAQVHIAPDQPCIIYNRHGQVHRRQIPPEIDAEWKKLFAYPEGWTIVDAEWLKGPDLFFIFDLIKYRGQVLQQLSYAERHTLLPRVYNSPWLQTLGIFKTSLACTQALDQPPEYVEGLVFRSLSSRGFRDSSIIRCRTKSQ